MSGIHEVVARSLVAKGFIEQSPFEKGLLTLTAEPLPAQIRAVLDDMSEDRELVQMLAVDVAAIQLTGHNGLKQRTGLLEHRYDAV